MRLMWVVGALFISVGVAFAVVTQFEVVSILQEPILPYLDGRNLITTHPVDAFKIVMLVSFALGLVLALPVILYHVWAFLSPALYQHEKKVVVPVLIAAALLFLAGISLSWFVILPFTLKFLLTFQSDSFEQMIRAAEYFGFATTISLAFGAVFEVPIVILLLTALGIVTPKMLHSWRRHAAVGSVILAAFITPGGDPMTLAVFSIPLYLLYEASVLVSEVVHRRRLRKEARREREEAAGRGEGALA